MAFTMRPGEPTTQAIRRRARTQLGRAADVLTDTKLPLSERIHEMRTSIKKVRALVALSRAAAPRKAHRADRRLHKLAAVTSNLRDAEIVVKTLDAIVPGLTRSRKDAALVKARLRLVTRLRGAERAFNAASVAESVTVQLLRERHRVRGWVPPHGGAWNKLWREPCVGLSKTYRRARSAMAHAYDDLSPDAFHAWRKAVKTHRYQMLFLQGVWPRPPTTHLAELEQLGEMLGEEHDLAVLEETVARDLTCLPLDSDRDRLRALIDLRRRALRAEARPIGERLFRERARIFRRRLQDRFRTDAQLGGDRRERTEADQDDAAVEVRDAPAPAPAPLRMA